MCSERAHTDGGRAEVTCLKVADRPDARVDLLLEQRAQHGLADLVQRIFYHVLDVALEV